MTCRSDTAGASSYVFCPDDPPLAADRLRAVVRWAAVDEITHSGPDVDYTIRTQSLGLQPRISRDGLMGLVGNPARLYPGLDAATVDIAYSVAAPNYLTRSLQVTLGPIPAFPAQFAPVDAGTLWMHRRPFVLRGRVVQLGGLNPTPLAGVPVEIAGVWWTFPPANVIPSSVIEAPDMVSLHPGLYADRVQGIAGLRRRDLVPVAGQDKTLVLPATVGGVTVRVSDRVGVAVGTVLAFEPAQPDRVEYLTVTAVSGASTDDQPAMLTLAHPLRLAHEEGTPVQVVTPQAPGTNNLFERDGIPFERVAFLAAMNGVTAGVVEISGGPAAEYQTASLYSTVSDADGFFRLPPLSRVASVKILANQAPAQELVMSPDYGRYENLVDVVYP
jgi:hypothetical protein